MNVFEYPSPLLKEPADEVREDDREIGSLVSEMVRVMREAPGVGLAATQIGVQKRVIVYQVEEDGPACALVNPVLVETSNELVTEEEGCLSFPGVVVAVQRPSHVVCEGVDESGRPVRVEAGDLLARVIQHEIDHLDGVLIVDRASPEERREALRLYREIRGD